MEGLPKDLPKDLIDAETFGQILDMDDDDTDRDFSKTIVVEFFTQAENTFKDIEEKLRKGDLTELSSLGHYLKGSSATLGLIKIKNACEAIQNLGAGLDEAGRARNTTQDELLRQIEIKLKGMKGEYAKVKAYLNNFYNIC